MRVGSPVWPPNNAELSIPLATLNTFNLILSSWTVIKSWVALKENNFSGFKKYMGITLLCTFFFLIIKAIEYTSKFNSGIYPSTDNFYGIYFTLTGLHALHVIGGIFVFAYLWGPGSKCGKQSLKDLLIELKYLDYIGTSLIWCGFSFPSIILT